MTTRRILSARRTAADALAWLPYAAPPAAALAELVEALAVDFHDGDRADALLTLVDEHDTQAEGLLLLACSLNLDRADPMPNAGQALADHVERTGTTFGRGDPAVPTALAQYVALVAQVHHAGDRRAAFRDLVNRCDARLAAMFAAVVGVEL